LLQWREQKSGVTICPVCRYEIVDLEYPDIKPEDFDGIKEKLLNYNNIHPERRIILWIDIGENEIPDGFFKKIKNIYKLIVEGANFSEAILDLEELIMLSFESLNRKLKFPSGDLGKLKNLKLLCLKGYKIETLPQSLVNLKNLEYLDLSYNCLETLPQSFVNLEKLKCLNIFKNCFVDPDRPFTPTYKSP